MEKPKLFKKDVFGVSKVNDKKKKKRIGGCFTVILLVLFVVFGAGIFLWNFYNDSIYTKVDLHGKSIQIEVLEGETLISIIPSLMQSGLIKNEEAFRIYLRLNNISPNIKFGQYTISENVNAIELIEMLEKGVSSPDTKLTIKEGLRISQIGDVIKNALPSESKFSITEFNSITSNPDNVDFSGEVKEFLQRHKPVKASLEGFLFPDTYFLNANLTTKEIVEKMVQNFSLKLGQEINLESLNLSQNNVQNIYQAIILGSIVEKEASGTDDKELISGVLHNRLTDSYLLQSDATINYITGKNDPGVEIADTQIDSPFNTYKYTGLPPGPINNPGIASIKVAFYPKQTDYYFFFHDSSGNTHYSVTYYEHNQKLDLYM